MRSAVATLPVQQVESESAAPLPAGASLAIGRANGLEDIGEAPASRSVPWPAAQQVIDQLRIRRTKAETTVELHARGPLMAWVQQEAQAQRLTIRVPRSSVDCAVPRPRGLVQRVTLRREEDAWALSFDLEGQLHVLDAAPVDDGHGLRIRIRQAPAIDASKPLVLVDPGHGGYDPGAPGPGGHDESQVALGVARLLGEALAEAGLQAVLTRTMDAEVRLADRVALTEKLGPVAFVSLHCNSSDAPEVGGIETYYRHDSGHSLARAIQEKLVDATGGSDRGIRSGRLYVLRGERIPATLVEMGFISSRTEEAKLVDPEYQKIVARAIAAGVKAYLDGKPTAVARPPAPGG